MNHGMHEARENFQNNRRTIEQLFTHLRVMYSGDNNVGDVTTVEE